MGLDIPGSPIRVKVPLKFIADLQAEAQDISAKGTSQIEVGGVLLGYAGNASTTEIRAYAYIPADSQPDGRYVLDATKLEALRKATDKRAEENEAPPLSVVGYFRTQSEDELRLRDEEVAFVREHFRDPSNVALLVQTAGVSSKAGFLFWSGGDFFPFSFMDFPLDAEQLRASSRKNATESPFVPPPDQGETFRDPAPRQRRPSRTLAAVSAAMIALAGLSAVWLMHRHRDASKAVGTVSPAVSHLQLEVEARGNGVEIRWDPANSLITHALKGNLVVVEQDQPPETATLGPASLATGHAYYQSSAGRLEIQLQVVDPSGKTFMDSITMMSSRSTAAAPPANPLQAPANLPSGQVSSDQEEIQSPLVAKIEPDGAVGPTLDVPRPSPGGLTPAPRPLKPAAATAEPQKQPDSNWKTVELNDLVSAPIGSASPAGRPGKDADAKTVAASSVLTEQADTTPAGKAPGVTRDAGPKAAVESSGSSPYDSGVKRAVKSVGHFLHIGRKNAPPTNSGIGSPSLTEQARPLSPSFLVFDGTHVVGSHLNGGDVGPTSLYPGLTSPAKPGETIVLFAKGFGPVSTPSVSGSVSRSGSLSPLPVVTIGGLTATVQFARAVAPGEFQFDVVVPSSAPDGDQPLVAAYNGLTTQAEALITILH